LDTLLLSSDHSVWDLLITPLVSSDYAFGQKIIKSLSDDTKGVIKTEEGKKKYQMGNQKIPNGQSEDTKWVMITPFGIF
jgi:hypothetical protein